MKTLNLSRLAECCLWSGVVAVLATLASLIFALPRAMELGVSPQTILWVLDGYGLIYVGAVGAIIGIPIWLAISAIDRYLLEHEKLKNTVKALKRLVECCFWPGACFGAVLYCASRAIELDASPQTILKFGAATGVMIGIPIWLAITFIDRYVLKPNKKDKNG